MPLENLKEFQQKINQHESLMAVSLQVLNTNYFKKTENF